MTKSTALLVIDMQVGVVDWPATGPAGEQVLQNIRSLLARARGEGVPVLYVQDDDLGVPVGSPEWQIHPAVAPEPGEPVVNKLASDAFYQTTLADELTVRGVTRLVVCGARTQYCVDTTCRSAVARGYDVVLVGDAHMTMENGVISAEQIIAHTNRTLNGFGNARNEIAVRTVAEVDLVHGNTPAAS